MRLHFFPYRYADAVLEHPAFADDFHELKQILERMAVPLLDPANPDPKKGGVKRRARKPTRDVQHPRYFFLPVNQKALNDHLKDQFLAKGWTLHPLVVDPARRAGPISGLKADFKKGRLQIEIQFGNMARWYTDVFKFQLSYSLDEIDVGVLVVPRQALANLIDENVANYERVVRELPWAKMSLTLPILVIGMDPDDYGPLERCYHAAGDAFLAHQENQGTIVAKIDYRARIQEEPKDDEE